MTEKWQYDDGCHLENFRILQSDADMDKIERFYNHKISGWRAEGGLTLSHKQISQVLSVFSC